MVRLRPLCGPRELLCYDRQVILLERDQSTAGVRCSLSHAIAHIELGHMVGSLTERFQGREERAADEVAAERLIPFWRLLDAVRWTSTESELARELWVDRDTLRVRVATLHPDDREVIRREMDSRDG